MLNVWVNTYVFLVDREWLHFSGKSVSIGQGTYYGNC